MPCETVNVTMGTVYPRLSLVNTVLERRTHNSVCTIATLRTKSAISASCQSAVPLANIYINSNLSCFSGNLSEMSPSFFYGFVPQPFSHAIGREQFSCLVGGKDAVEAQSEAFTAVNEVEW